MKTKKFILGMLAASALCLPGRVEAAGTWTPLINPPPGAAGHFLLLTDGSVMAEDLSTNYGPGWYRLTPDIHGSYANGTWINMASMSFTRLDFVSLVLTNGNVLVAGGEYGTGRARSEIYDPVSNLWTTIAVPTSVLNPVAISPQFGIFQGFLDAGAIVLPDGRALLAPVGPNTKGGTVMFYPGTQTWSNGPAAFSTNANYQDEASWELLPDGSVLTVDGAATTSERFIPASNIWVKDANVPVPLYDVWGAEIGPAMLLPNGKAIFFGGNTNTAIYTPSGTTNQGSWVAGPHFPNGQGMPDAPAAMMVNGKILCATCIAPTNSTIWYPPVSFYEYDYLSNSFTQVLAPSGSNTFNGPVWPTLMLDLPDGTMLFGHRSTDFYIYQPDGVPIAAGKPTVSSVAINTDGSMHLSGTLFNGLCRGASYGDDEQMDSNFPLVRFTDGNGNVRYGRTYNWSSTGVATGTNIVSTDCAVPSGASMQDTIQVVANGIASDGASLPVALDTTTLLWTTAGNRGWGIETSVTHDGVDAAQSGAIGNSQVSYLQTTVTGPGTLSFWWKVSSEHLGGTVYDFLRFFLDGVQQPGAPGIGGEVDWQLGTIPVPSGPHTLRWSYIKDGSDIWPKGSDAGWLDQVVFIPSEVANLNDGGPGSLRQTIADGPAGTVITFAPALSGQTIVLTSGEILLDKNLTIDGSALVSGLTIDGNNASRVFEIAASRTVAINQITITGGASSLGGGVLNQGTLFLDHVSLVSNFCSGRGGAINNAEGGALRLNNSTVSGNTATDVGGGIVNSGSLTATNSTLSGNNSLGSGGGQGFGGAIFNFDVSLTLVHCTLSGNTATTFGGGLRTQIGTLTIQNTVIAGNTASTGGDIANSGSTTFIITGTNLIGDNSTVAAEFPAGTLAGTLASPLNPLLCPLGNYGGPTLTRPLLSGSPAIEAAAASALTADQRGLPRPLGLAPDIGAVEGVFNPAFTLASPTLVGGGTFHFAFSNLNGMPFTVLASPDVSLPLSNWTVVGVPTEISPGQYEFTDVLAMNSPKKFYGVVAGQNLLTRWASSVLGFSSQYTALGWSAAQALGEPDTYPTYGDIFTAWATAEPDAPNEFLELGFDAPAPISSVSIYETYAPGAVSKVSVRNANTSLWVEVWSGTATPAPPVARIFTVTFPITSFPVDAVRIDLDSLAVPDWNEIDAVSIGVDW